MGLFSAVYRKNFVHRYDDDHIIHYFSSADFPTMEQRPVEFRTPQGFTVRGHIYSYPAVDKDDLVVFCHGLGGGHRSYMREIETICRQGYQVLSYDVVGCWESDGPDIRGLSEFLNDLVSCLDFIRSSKDLRGRGLHIIGHSAGGYAAGNILNYRTDMVRSITVISGFSSIGDLADRKLGPFRRLVLGFERKANPEYYASSEVAALGNAQVRVLLIHSKDDQMVPIDAGLSLVRSSVSNDRLSFLEVENRFHNPNYTDDAVAYMGRTFSEYNGLKSLGERKAFMDGRDFWRMTEQDPVVWKRIFDHMAGGGADV